MNKSDLILKVKAIFDDKLAQIKSDKFKEYEEKLHLSRDFFDDLYYKLMREYKGLNGRRILSTIEMMLKNLKMNPEEATKAERTIEFVGNLNYYIGLFCTAIIHITLSGIFLFLSKLIVEAGLTLNAVYMTAGLLTLLLGIIRPILYFIKYIICAVILGPIVEETSKLIYSNKSFITKYVQMFNLDENMDYYIYKDPDTNEVYYRIATGIARMRSQCVHIITAYVMKTKHTFNSKILSYITAICIHGLFNFTLKLPDIIGHKLWVLYSNHLINKYGDMLEEYKRDIQVFNKNKSINKIKESYYKKVKRCYPNVRFI